MHWLGICFFIGAAIVGIRWMLARTDVLGRRRSFPILGVVLLVALGGASLAPWVLRYRLEDRLSLAAGAIVGNPVSVFCQSFGEAFIDTGAEYGYVEFDEGGLPERKAVIKRDQCRDLRAYIRSDKRAPTWEQAIALHTLTHEAIHMSGVTSESVTECIALQRDAETARVLGATPDAAKAISFLYWQVVYPRMPEDYRSDQCRPGGELDIRGPDAPWSRT